MQFNAHTDLTGQHAFLSASKYHWIRYDDQKLAAAYTAAQAARRGTEFHALAAELIRMGVKLPNNSKTLNAYVNDALGYRMSPEVVLFYSTNAFGTADAISFRKNKLRIHDLKMGITQTSFDQLSVYGALFCLEYGFKPMEIDMEFRIYQNDDARVEIGDPDYVTHIMSRIITADQYINQIRQEVVG